VQGAVDLKGKLSGSSGKRVLWCSDYSRFTNQIIVAMTGFRSFEPPETWHRATSSARVGLVDGRWPTSPVAVFRAKRHSGPRKPRPIGRGGVPLCDRTAGVRRRVRDTTCWDCWPSWVPPSSDHSRAMCYPRNRPERENGRATDRRRSESRGTGASEASRGRVALGSYPPRAPTDPDRPN